MAEIDSAESLKDLGMKILEIKIRVYGVRE
jgi:hypothetical protein